MNLTENLTSTGHDTIWIETSLLFQHHINFSKCTLNLVSTTICSYHLQSLRESGLI